MLRIFTLASPLGRSRISPVQILIDRSSTSTKVNTGEYDGEEKRGNGRFIFRLKLFSASTHISCFDKRMVLVTFNKIIIANIIIEFVRKMFFLAYTIYNNYISLY